jgi:Flp pilus assembly pilin Flp
VVGEEGGGVKVKARHWARQLVGRQEGQTLFEYAITIFFVVIACVALLSALGVNLTGLFTNAGAAL